ncbi:hypothetical protein ASG67_13390 [Sphingomonas sp. Leaf339]|nr:hypothetical protein ASG67_13390 [Sphingomonas sp. Leaf339]
MPGMRNLDIAVQHHQSGAVNGDIKISLYIYIIAWTRHDTTRPIRHLDQADAGAILETLQCMTDRGSGHAKLETSQMEMTIPRDR